MTLEQAKKIVEMHNYHTEERAKAKQLGDAELVEEHQTCLTLMQADYDKACDLLLKHNK